MKTKETCSLCSACILPITQGICPKKGCPKSLANGPCGGFVNGKCEVDTSKICIWVLAYEKLKATNRLEDFLKHYSPPQ